MALKIENEKIVGTIDNLQDKLEGKLPVDRLELLYLVNSWGRTKSFYIFDINQDIDIGIDIEECESKESYDLSKLDVSEITNMDSVFCFSNFNDIHSTNGIGLHDGDISNWDVSNVTSMNEMFFCAENFNQNLSNWDVSNVTNMKYMFYSAKEFNGNISNWDVSNVIKMSSMFLDAKSFNQNISKWNFNNIINCNFMFNEAESFLDKYNNGEPLSSYTDKIKEWFNLNRERMDMIDLKDKHGEEVDNFFSNILLTECNKLCL